MHNAAQDTLRGYKKELSGFLGWLTETEDPLPGPWALSDSHIRAYLTMLYEGGRSNATRAKALAVIRSWLDFFGRQHYVKENVARLVKRPRVHESNKTIPSEDEIL